MTETPEKQTGLPNPYGKTPIDEFRLNVNVALDDMLTIKALSPSKGTIQNFIATYVKSVADEVRLRKLTYSPENLAIFRDLILRRNQIPDGVVNPSTPGNANGANASGGKGSIRKRVADLKAKRTSTQSQVSQGRNQESAAGEGQNG